MPTHGDKDTVCVSLYCMYVLYFGLFGITEKMSKCFFFAMFIIIRRHLSGQLKGAVTHVALYADTPLTQWS